MFERLGDADVCYLTTTGRITGRPHEIEIWFAVREATLYASGKYTSVTASPSTFGSLT